MTQPITIRPPELGDARSLVRNHHNYNLKEWEDKLRELIQAQEEGKLVCVVAWQEHQVIGLATLEKPQAFAFTKEDNFAHRRQFYAMGCRAQDAYPLLLDACVAHCREHEPGVKIITANTLLGRNSGIRLLRKLGFRPYGKLKGGVQFGSATQDEALLALEIK